MIMTIPYHHTGAFPALVTTQTPLRIAYAVCRCHGSWMRVNCADTCALCVQTTCPWFGKHSDEKDVYVCADGTRCNSNTDKYGLACCKRHGGRSQCPKNLPYMCGRPNACVLGTDFCCSATAEYCVAKFSGARTCKGQRDPRVTVAITTKSPATQDSKLQQEACIQKCVNTGMVAPPVCHHTLPISYRSKCFAACYKRPMSDFGPCSIEDECKLPYRQFFAALAKKDLGGPIQRIGKESRAADIEECASECLAVDKGACRSFVWLSERYQQNATTRCYIKPGAWQDNRYTLVDRVDTVYFHRLVFNCRTTKSNSTTPAPGGTTKAPVPTTAGQCKDQAHCRKNWRPCCPGGNGVVKNQPAAFCGSQNCDINNKDTPCHGGYMRRECPYTCGLCPATTTTRAPATLHPCNGGREDVLKCLIKYKPYCMKSGYSSFTNMCPVLCGTCPSSTAPTIITTTPLPATTRGPAPAVNLTAQMPFSISAENAVAACTTTAANGTYSAGAVAMTTGGIGAMKYTVRLGQEAKTIVMGVVPLPLRYLEAVLLTHQVFHDSGAVRVACVVKDASFSVPKTTASTWQVKLSLTPDTSALGVLAANTPFPRGECTVGWQNKWRCVVSIALPKAWLAYDKRGPGFQATVSGFIARNGVKIQTSAISLAKEAVTVVKAIAPPAQQNTYGTHLFAELPSRPLNPGNTFVVKIYAVGARPLATITAKVKVTSALRIHSLTKAPGTAWKGDPKIVSQGREGVFAVFRDIEPGAVATTPEHVATLECKVNPQAPRGQHVVELELVDADDATGDKVVRQVPSVLASRILSITGNAAVFVVPDAIQGIFMLATETELVNTAVLDGIKTNAPLAAIGATMGGRFTAIKPAQLSGCKSPAPNVLTSDCSSVSMDGSEVSWAGKVEVRFDHPASNTSATQLFSVWFPTFPFEMTVSAPRIRPIHGWHDAASCAASAAAPSVAISGRYQQTRVSAEVIFQRSARAEEQQENNGNLKLLFKADITDRLTIESRSPVLGNVSRGGDFGDTGAGGGGGGDSGSDRVQCATISGRHTDGKKRGAMLMAIGKGKRAIGRVKVQVDPTSSVTVVGLVLMAVKGFGVVAPRSIYRFRAFAIWATPSEETQLTFEGDKAQLIAVAKLSDGTEMEITEEDGLKYSVRAEFNNSLAVTGGYASVPPRATSQPHAIIEAVWIPLVPHESCLNGSKGSSAGNRKPLASALLKLPVVLPAADTTKLIVKGAAKDNEGRYQLALQNSVASTAGVSTRADLSVILVFPGSRAVDVSVDERTRLTQHTVCLLPPCRSPSLGFSRSSEGKLSVFVTVPLPKTNSSQEGSDVVNLVLEVSFAHESVRANITFKLVTFKHFQVRATPWPLFPQSLLMQSPILHRLHGTTPVTFEHAMVGCRAVLSSGMIVPLSKQKHGINIFLSDSHARVNEHGQTVFDRPATHDEGAFTLSTIGPYTVLKPQRNASVDVHCTLGDESTVGTSHRLVVHALADKVQFLRRIIRLSLLQSRTRLSPTTAFRNGGPAGAVGVAEVVAEMTNKRMYTQTTHTGATSHLPGLFTFSSQVPSSLAIDPTKGNATLLSNSRAPVRVKVSAPISDGKGTASQTQLACNLDPSSAGDVDLGASDGLPLQSRKVGETFTLDMRINTGGKPLGPFDFRLLFDHAQLTLAGDATVNAKGSAVATPLDISVIDTVADSSGLRIFGAGSAGADIRSKPVLSSTGRAGWGGLLFAQIKFRAVNKGAASITGVVQTLGDTSQPPKPLAIPGTPFVAGNLEQLVVGGRRTRSDVKLEWADAEAEDPRAPSVQAPALAWRRQRQRRQQIETDRCTQTEHRVPGDVNGDCKVDVNDLSFLQQWVALHISGMNPSSYTENDRAVMNIVGEFGQSEWEKRADFDFNGETQLGDALFLLRVIGGKRVIVESLTQVRVGPCSLRTTVRVFLPHGTLPFCTVPAPAPLANSSGTGDSRAGCENTASQLSEGVRILVLLAHKKPTFASKFHTNSGDGKDAEGLAPKVRVGQLLPNSNQSSNKGTAVLIEAEPQIEVNEPEYIRHAGKDVGVAVEFLMVMRLDIIADFLAGSEPISVAVAQGVRTPTQLRGKDA